MVEGEFVVLLPRSVDEEPVGLGQGVHGVLDRRGVADHAVWVFLHRSLAPAETRAEGDDVPAPFPGVVEHGGEKAFLFRIAWSLRGRIDTEGPVHGGIAL